MLGTGKGAMPNQPRGQPGQPMGQPGQPMQPPTNKFLQPVHQVVLLRLLHSSVVHYNWEFYLEGFKARSDLYRLLCLSVCNN